MQFPSEKKTTPENLTEFLKRMSQNQLDVPDKLNEVEAHFGIKFWEEKSFDDVLLANTSHFEDFLQQFGKHSHIIIHDHIVEVALSFFSRCCGLRDNDKGIEELIIVPKKKFLQVSLDQLDCFLETIEVPIMIAMTECSLISQEWKEKIQAHNEKIKRDHPDVPEKTCQEWLELLKQIIPSSHNNDVLFKIGLRNLF